jgi:hypothetical protein
MNTLITVLAVTAILATSAIGKNVTGPTARPHSNNSMTRISATQRYDFYCHSHYHLTDPDPRIRLQLVRDCRYWEEE